jgi:NAD(P)H-hydrate epimerase
MPFPLEDRHGALSRKALEELRERVKACDVLALGPGLSREKEAAELARALLAEAQCPVVLDADGINALAGIWRYWTPGGTGSRG